ncbi:urate hydroxylase PuuD [Ancylobacter terrae]|uniref:urate hydroxylase PuuD n=1 Tax=Ancylobacter sp. sgz301288 TaxID=3342077 RepID=UPI00385B5815
MDVFISDWLNILIRWFHLIVGIGWIGASFYFVALDFGLRKEAGSHPGIYGAQWQVHGGGFYHVQKYMVAPERLPEHLHWFKWDAYLTWLTGFALLVVQYYWHAESYLIDPAVAALAKPEAIMISIASLAGGFLIYDWICRSPLGRRTDVLAVCVFVLIVGAAWLFTQVFSGRGAFIHVGAFIGTIMAANVFVVIMPGQRKTVAQMLAGETPEPIHGIRAKQRSLHNNYLTLPVLLMMVSNHYPLLFGHPHSWLVVALILVVGGLIRHIINSADAGKDFLAYGWAAPAGLFALACAIVFTAPTQGAGGPVMSDQQAVALIAKHCTMCHAATPSHDGFSEAPKGVMLDSLAAIRSHRAAIIAQAVQGNAMPLGNETAMSADERTALGAWLRAQR